MSVESQRSFPPNGNQASQENYTEEMVKLNIELEAATRLEAHNSVFHGDEFRSFKRPVMLGGFWGVVADLKNLVTLGNISNIIKVGWKYLQTRQVDMVAGAPLIGSFAENSSCRAHFIEGRVIKLYQRMLHPPITYLGDAFQYRTADGKFNNVLMPHLGQAGTPYAKTVPSQTHTLGALPDPGDVYDRLMAREGQARESKSGLSSMLLYHATIIIHDIFRTNDKDKNISDSSSYLDLSPLYGYTEKMQRQVRDDKYKLGLLKPDTFAEDRLLRQPPGVCIMLVMYNRYHNYVATQLRRINENGRFSIPRKYAASKLVATVKAGFTSDQALKEYLKEYEAARDDWKKNRKPIPDTYTDTAFQRKINAATPDEGFSVESFQVQWQDAWNKLDDDLFNTARLITCGLYANISIHDYLRALMGFHKYKTAFTLDPRMAINKDGQRDAVSRGIGNQVTTEFNLLYRFHCAISKRDESYTENFMKESIGPLMGKSLEWNPQTLTLQDYLKISRATKESVSPWTVEFGLHREGEHKYSRNVHSGLFDDQQMIDELLLAMDAPIGNFGAKNVPKCLKTIEIMGIIQARKWEAGTLNDFRDFFGMERHKDFKSITGNIEVQNALRDLYDHPDDVELYPGIFCEGDAEGKLNLDPGPAEKSFALWEAIFSDAITLVRSDRFYTVDWNTKSLTSWGMKEVTPDPEVLKSSMFHRLIQRAFPGWFPYDSIRFFHPFYTGLQNAEYAKDQGFEKEFAMTLTPNRASYDPSNSNPKKPVKPIYLTEFSQIKAVLSSKNSGLINHSAAFHNQWMPDKIKQLFAEPRLKIKAKDIFSADSIMVSDYFKAITREMINREAYAVGNGTYQIDVTRDLAIPVVTRFVADFLGFNRRVKSTTNPGAEYSENQIYQHITNCQLFFGYTADETKMLERRAAAKKSLEFLLELTKNGHIKTANSFLHRLSRLFQSKKPPKNMIELGLNVAEQALEREKNDAGRAAAILVLAALDGAFNSVLAFSAILNHFIDDLYKQEGGISLQNATASRGLATKVCDWKKIQELVMDDDQKNDAKIRNLVIKAQRLSVRLPVVRKVTESGDLVDESNNKIVSVVRSQLVICDIFQAYAKELNTIPEMNTEQEENYAMFGSTLSDGLSHFDSQKLAITGLTAMIKVLAQTKNLRRGHDTQGKLKRIRVDQTTEGYANFIAPGRMDEIHDKVKHVLKDSTDKENINSKERKDAEKIKSILDDKILQPALDIYMTPEWDEMIPFPTTWKVRFDGYGASNYSPHSLNRPAYPDDFPPFYQPQGPSHSGGSFAELTPPTASAGQGKNREAADSTPAAAIGGDVRKMVAGCGALGF